MQNSQPSPEQVTLAIKEAYDLWLKLKRIQDAAPEMLEVLKYELSDLQDDIRWADGGELERLMMRRDRLMAVLTKAEPLI